MNIYVTLEHSRWCAKQTLTAQDDSSKHGVVSLQRAAIPSMMSELVLAFPDPLFGSLSYGLHEVWVSLAQLSLLVYQTWNVVAYDPSTQRANIPVGTHIDRLFTMRNMHPVKILCCPNPDTTFLVLML